MMFAHQKNRSRRSYYPRKKSLQTEYSPSSSPSPSLHNNNKSNSNNKLYLRDYASRYSIAKDNNIIGHELLLNFDAKFQR